MTRTDYCAGPNAHLLIGEMPAPRQMAARWREGTGLSIAAHGVALGLLLYAATHGKQVAQAISAVSEPLIFLERRGPGGGGGHEGAKPADLPRPPAIVATRPTQVTPVPNPADSPPRPEMNIPVITAQATQMLPGAPTALDTASLGKGTGSPGSNGRGSSSGSGEGPGLDAGRLSGYGGETVGPGAGVNAPQLIKEVKPSYTVGAMQAKLQGTVEIQAVVLSDGSVDPSRIRIARSLDASFGLDQQAVAAVRQWRFLPATRRGEPVAMWVDVELTFTLR